MFLTITACLALASDLETEAAPSLGEAAEAPAPAPRWPGQVTPSSPHYDLELLYSAAKFVELDKAIDQRLATNPDDPDLYWMKARVMFELGELMGQSATPDARLRHYTKMQTMAEKGLALRPGDPHIRFARGLAMARLGTTKGVLSSLFMAKSIESDWLAAVASPTPYASAGGREVLPSDAQQALGVFYRLVPDWWIVQVLAGTRGDLDKSLAFLEQAVAGRATLSNVKELGVTQLCIGTQRDDAAMLAKGQATLDRGLTMPVDDDKDLIDIKHIRMLKGDPSLACEYSRDGQQDLDKAKLEE